MFHGCGISTGSYGHTLRGFDAVTFLNAKLDEYKGEGWRMFALMKKVIADNNFNFAIAMDKIYNN